MPTPPRIPKQADGKSVRKFPISRKALPTNLHKKIINSCKIPSDIRKIQAISTISAPVVSKTQIKMPTDDTKATFKKSPLQSKTAKVASNNMVKTLERVKSTSKTPSILPPTRTNLSPRTLKMLPTPSPSVKSAANKKPQETKPENTAKIPSTATIVKKSGAVGKIKRTEMVKQAKKSPLKSGYARLAQNLKAKKPLNCSKKLSSAPSIHVNGRKLLNMFNNNNQEIEDMIIQTPKDFATLNPFEEFVTSTKLRTSGHNLGAAEGLNPIDNKRSHSNSTAKRNILQEEAQKFVKDTKGVEIVKKYNFIISNNAEETDIGNEPNPINIEVELKSQKKENNNSSNRQESKLEEKTPPKSGCEEKPSNYLSPFVTVTRGKVSLKKETEKRNSIYMLNEALEPSDLSKCSIEARRTLEAVRYFRQQLQAEIDRLHKSCDIWEQYKGENLEKIQNANGEDMINVAIGQTRLLTSKKFMQFKGLIDRCESGVTGIGAVVYDGSEDTKPITSVDLEGFWSMLGLQIDNLNKRFETLNRWKSNDWADPDEVKPKIKKNLSKVKKAKTTTGAAVIKPNSRLQQVMRKMQAEMRRNKKNENSPNVIVLTQKQRRSGVSNSSTPRRSIDNSLTSRRMSIVVKDRKYFSPAATVISVPNRNRRSLLQRTDSEESPKILQHTKVFNDALDTMEACLDPKKPLLTSSHTSNSQLPALNKENYQPEFSSPVPSGSKSILKTPGTAKSRIRNVIFNEKLRVKKYNFAITEDGDALNAASIENNESIEEDLAKSRDGKYHIQHFISFFVFNLILNIYVDETDKEDGCQRTLSLRNRQVHLRPSCEIVIPYK